MCRFTALSALVVVFTPLQAVNADVDVFVDFVSDIGDGMGGGANGTADWIDNLATLTTAAGVDAFTPTERGTIETNIISKLSTMYGAFSGVTVSTTSAGSEERVSFGAYDGTPGSLGVAPGNILNTSDHDGSEGTAARVFTNNFGFILDEFSGSASRATQIEQISAALAGTGGHELGHALGVLHHHAYGDPGISPANYANTADIQNTHVIATGSTGLGEIGRETDRTFSKMSNLMLEAAGGGFFGGSTVAGTVLTTTTPDITATDSVGGTTGSATALALTSLPVSGLDSAMATGVLQTAADVDVFSFAVSGASRFWGQIWSEFQFGDSFDTRLRLFDADGTTVLATNEDVHYDGNTFDSGTFRQNDSALLNISLPDAGTYFIEVASLGAVGGDADGFYTLLFGADMTAIPEPSSLLLMAMVAFSFGARRWRKKNCVGKASS